MEEKWLKGHFRVMRMCMEKKKIKTIVAPCCSYGHKTRCLYISMFLLLQGSMKIVSNVAIKLYGSALRSKYKDKLLPYDSILLCSVKPKSYLLIEALKLCLPYYFHPNRLTLFYEHQEKFIHGQTTGVRPIYHLYPV